MEKIKKAGINPAQCFNQFVLCLVITRQVQRWLQFLQDSQNVNRL